MKGDTRSLDSSSYVPFGNWVFRALRLIIIPVLLFSDRHTKLNVYSMGGFPKLGVPFWGVPTIRNIIVWGLYEGPTILGNYNILWSLKVFMPLCIHI